MSQYPVAEPSSYPEEGAQDLFRAITTIPDDQEVAYHDAQVALLAQIARLFVSYKYRVLRGNIRMDDHWVFTPFRKGQALAIAVRFGGQFYWFIGPDGPSGDISAGLEWDRANQVLVGPPLPDKRRDLTKPGLPLLRISPVEALTAKILEVLHPQAELGVS